MPQLIVPEELAARIIAFAKEQQRDPQSLLNDLLETGIDKEETDAAIERGVAEVEAGHWVDAKEVAERILRR